MRAVATYKAAPPSPPASGPTPVGPSPQTQAVKDPKCDLLHRKLKRQQQGLAQAISDAKRAQIAANIEDTVKRLRKLGC